MINIENLELMYFSNDEPVPYQLKCGVKILIYPIKVKDWNVFNNNLGILTIDKNATGNVDAIRMSYFDFLANLIQHDKDYFYQLGEVLKYSLNEKVFSIEVSNGKNFLSAVDENGNIKYYINSDEFNDIKRIILFQNIYDYDDIELSDDVKKIVEDYYKLTSSGNKKVTLEERVAVMGNTTGMTKKEILDMTNRDFNIRFDLLLDEIEYKINKTAEMSGNVKFKNKIEHFIFKKKRDKLSQFFVDSTTVGEVIGNPTN